MRKHTLQLLIVMLCLVLTVGNVYAQSVKEPPNTNPEWTKPYPPFRVAGNLYYVGTYDLGCYLVTSPQGHILINTGLASSASLLKASIESLGFKLSDVKILLTTQAHHDHNGAMAAIKKMTGAKFMVNEKDAEVVKDGGRSDYFSGGPVSTFQPVAIDRLLKNNDVVKLGDNELTMLHHPGHTKGSCSYLFTVKDEKQSYRVLIANIPSIIINGKFSEVKSYPGMQQDYAYTLKAMKDIPFDIWLASHASQFDLQGKHKPGAAYNPAAFIDREGYDDAIKQWQDVYDEKIKEK